MMYHIRQLFVFAMIFCVVGLVLWSSVETPEPPPPVELKIILPTQEMTPQQFEQRHLRRLPPVESQPVIFWT